MWYLLAIAADTESAHHGRVAGAIRNGFRVCFLGAFRGQGKLGPDTEATAERLSSEPGF